jgi:hypothetical protein
MTEEEHLREIIAMIHRDYQKQLEPYMRRLITLESLKPPQPFFMTQDQAKALGIPTKEK